MKSIRRWLQAVLATSAIVLAPSAATAARKKKPEPVVAAPVAPAASVRTAVELWRTGDYNAAVAMWVPFANAGDPDAMFNIGQAYKLGRAVPKDLVLARDWYRRAAQKGHLPAQANLGILLFQAGEKVEAVRWLKAAADKNELRAQYVLGVANWNGDGLPRNLTLAYAYLSRAAALGLPEAVSALSSLTSSLSPVERANGWAVATSLAAGNGVPPEFGGPRGAPVAVAVARDEVIKPAPQPTTAAVAAAQIAPAMARPAPVTAPVEVAAAVPPKATPAPAPTPAVSVPKPAPAPQRTPPVQLAAAEPAAKPAPAPQRTSAVQVAAAKPVRDPPAVQQREQPAPAPARATPAVTTASVPPSSPAPAPVAEAVKPKLPARATIQSVEGPRVVPSPKAPLAWRVQLGAFSKKAQAEAVWTEVKTQQKQLVAKAQPIFTADGSVTKLQMGPYASKAAARDACARIAFTGRACFVTEG